MSAIGQESDPDKGRYLRCPLEAAYGQVPKLPVQPAPAKANGNLCSRVNGVWTVSYLSQK